TYNFYLQAPGNPYGSDLHALYSAYAPTDYTLVLQFHSESYWHINRMTKPILPKHIFTEIPLDEWNQWDPQPGGPTFVTSGPFYVSDYVAGEYTELIANPHYFRNQRMVGPSHETERLSSNPDTFLTATEPVSVTKTPSPEQTASGTTLSSDETVRLTWTANDNPIPTVLEEGDTATGDHVVVNASYLPSDAKNITMAFCESYFEDTASLVIPDPEYDPFSGVIDPSQFSWMTVSGIGEGDEVRLVVNFTNGDSDVMAWWAGTDNTTWTYDNNLLGTQMTTGAKPENGSFIADWSGTLKIGCFDYDLTPGNWTLQMEIGDQIIRVNSSGWVTYDTYQFGRNISRTVKVYGFNSTDDYFERIYTSLRFNNFFAPQLQIIEPNGGETLTGTTTVSWEATSRNADNQMRHEVWISTDAGDSYQLYASNLTQQSAQLYTGDWKLSSTTLIRVRTNDRGMSSEDVSDSHFSMGNASLVDTHGPVIFAHEEYHLPLNESDTGSVDVTLAVLDLNPGIAHFSIDGSELAMESWVDSRQIFSVHLEDLGLGLHTLLVSARDAHGNANAFTVSIRVGPLDDIAPSVSSPANITYTYGEIGNQITWEVADEYPGEYSVLRNGTIVALRQWETDTITVNVDGLEPGTYNYTLCLTDLSRNQAHSTVFVFVLQTPYQTIGVNPVSIAITAVSLVVIVALTPRLVQRVRGRE
ncbi:hypothetical protein EU546_06980, partial [Candidatus Thorarchaeota archaeon]